MRTEAQNCKPVKITLEIISYSLESSEAFISKLSSLTQEQKQSGNSVILLQQAINSSVHMKTSQAIKQNSTRTRTAKTTHTRAWKYFSDTLRK